VIDVRVMIVRLPGCEDLSMPSKATAGSAGFDLQAAVAKSTVFQPLERALIPTGIQIALPHGYEAQVRPRSGLALRHGITTLNSPGTIDADYRGEIHVLLINMGSDCFIVNRGDRIAQLVIAQLPHVEFCEVETLPESQRGAGGFGHTGK